MNKLAKGCCFAGVTFMTGVATYALGQSDMNPVNSGFMVMVTLIVGAVVSFSIPSVE